MDTSQTILEAPKRKKMFDQTKKEQNQINRVETSTAQKSYPGMNRTDQPQGRPARRRPKRGWPPLAPSGPLLPRVRSSLGPFIAIPFLL